MIILVEDKRKFLRDIQDVSSIILRNQTLLSLFKASLIRN